MLVAIEFTCKFGGEYQSQIGCYTQIVWYMVFYWILNNGNWYSVVHTSTQWVLKALVIGTTMLIHITNDIAILWTTHLHVHVHVYTWVESSNVGKMSCWWTKVPAIVGEPTALWCYWHIYLNSGVPSFGVDKALEGHSIVCEQCCAPPLLCLLRTTVRHCT